jgi:hypothetical protein
VTELACVIHVDDAHTGALTARIDANDARHEIRLTETGKTS